MLAEGDFQLTSTKTPIPYSTAAKWSLFLRVTVWGGHTNTIFRFHLHTNKHNLQILPSYIQTQFSDFNILTLKTPFLPCGPEDPGLFCHPTVCSQWAGKLEERELRHWQSRRVYLSVHCDVNLWYTSLWGQHRSAATNLEHLGHVLSHCLMAVLSCLSCWGGT